METLIGRADRNKESKIISGNWVIKPKQRFLRVKRVDVLNVISVI